MSDEGSNLPSESELLETLRECVQEVFAMMMATIDEAVVHASDDTSVAVENASGEIETEATDVEAVVSFHGQIDGFVVLRCSALGAVDVARTLLMMEDGETLQLEEITDALGECVNMIAGSLKTKALDPVADFQLGLPTAGRGPKNDAEYRCGSLAYKLSEGLFAAELWLAPPLKV